MRATLRISSRSIRRHPGRSAAVIALVVLPVAALTVLLTISEGSRVRSDAEQQRQFGDDVAIAFPNSGPGSSGVDTSAPTADEVRQALGLPGYATIRVERVGTVALAREDRTVDMVALHELARSDGDVPVLRLDDGRIPNAPGEVVVRSAERPVLGSELTIDVPPVTTEVVGWIRAASPDWASPGSTARTGDPDATPIQELWAAPGTFPASLDDVWTTSGLDAAPALSYRIGGVDPALLDGFVIFSNSDFSVLLRDPQSSERVAQFSALGISLFGFAWCGLVAASALAIGARRRRRELGLLSASGASPRQLRWAVVADGAVLGGVGGLLGGLLGAGLALWIHGPGWQLLGFGGGSPEVAFTPLVFAAGGFGWLSAVLAGALAGRGVSRQPTLDLLAGRAPRPGAAPTWFATGAAAVAISFGTGWATSISRQTGPGDFRVVLTVVCAVAGFVGLVCLSVGVIRLLPAWTAGRGLATRTAARDLARFGARTTGAVAAIAITLSGATFASFLERRVAADAEQQKSATESSIGTTQRSTALVGSERQVLVDGVIRNAGLDAERFRSLTAMAHEKGIDVTPLASGPDIRSCISNAEAIIDAIPDDYTRSRFDADGCVATTAVRVEPSDLSVFDPASAADLRAGRLVAMSAYASMLGDTAVFDGGGVDPGRVPISLGTVTFEAGGQFLGQPVFRSSLGGSSDLAANGSIISIAGSNNLPAVVFVPSDQWVGALADRSNGAFLIEPSASSGDRDGKDWYRTIDALGVDVLSSTQISASDVKWGYTAVFGVGGAIAVLTLLVLSLSLVLVRLESRDEETVLSHQGATRRAIAMVCAWRAILATAVAAVPAFVLSVMFLWVVGGAKITWPHPVSAALILVGMPLLAGAVFGLAGLRTPRVARTVT